MKLLHEDATPETLNIVRLWIFGLWFLKIALDPLQQLAELPVSIFRPVTPLTWLPSEAVLLLLTAPALTVFRVVGAVSALASALGWKFHWMAPLCCVVLTIHQALIRSYGGINHAEITLLLAAYALLLFAGADWTSARWKVDRQPANRHAVPIVAIVTILCTSYVFTGVHRLVYGGVQMFTSDSMEHWTYTRSSWDSEVDFSYGKLLKDHPATAWPIRLSLPLVTAMEVLAPITLISRRFRLLFVLITLPFHIGTILVMNISFWENALLYMLFIDVDRQTSRATLRAGRSHVLFFDGVCNLCNGFVNWMMARDRRGIFRFASLQGRTAAEVLGSQRNALVPQSIVLVDETGSYQRSEAVLRAVSRLGALWWVVGLLRWIPVSLRDWVYDRIAGVRYRIFGQSAVCRTPAPQEQFRFLE